MLTTASEQKASGVSVGERVETRPAAGRALSEDWLAVCLGAFLIGVVLAGLRPAWPSLGWADASQLAGDVLGFGNIQRVLFVSGGLILLACLIARAIGQPVTRFAAGFTVLLALSWVAQLIAGQTRIRFWGLEYVIFALLIGLTIGNAIRVPRWLVDAARTELYIKIGLVLLGATVLFGDLWRAGLLGIGQSILVVTAVWFFSYWLSKRLRVDDELTVMLASAVSICGVSAAIAACGAIQGDRKKLSYVTSLVLIVAVPMMVLMPRIISSFGIPEVVGGAWLGGTLDTSASVVAAGEIIGSTARNAGVVVKLSQNVLIGVAAFALTIWWALRRREGAASQADAGVIWERFPKFVLGFLAASFVFSFFLEPAVITQTKAPLDGLRTIWFALAFTSIGLETRFGELVRVEEGRPALAFLGAQSFNVVWTLLLAYLFFGGFVFPTPTFD